MAANFVILLLMQFAILTTTYKRSHELARCIESVQNQNSKNFVHYIVNDSPGFDYTFIEKDTENYSNIVYLKNENNIGKNKSLNRILDLLSKNNFTGYILYLDDDDWLSPNCLYSFQIEVEKAKTNFWFVSNRGLISGKTLTENKTGKNVINYIWSYLILKRFKGDATHCINFEMTSPARFPENIKNGEEWLYFSSISKYIKSFKYLDFVGTYSEGYHENGLTKAYTKPDCKALLNESRKVGLATIYFYTILRIIKINI